MAQQQLSSATSSGASGRPYHNCIWTLYETFVRDPSLLEDTPRKDLQKNSFPHILHALNNDPYRHIVATLYRMDTFDARLRRVHAALRPYLPDGLGPTSTSTSTPSSTSRFTAPLMTTTTTSTSSAHTNNKGDDAANGLEVLYDEATFVHAHTQTPSKLIHTLCIAHDLYRTKRLLDVLPTVQSPRKKPAGRSRARSLVEWGSVWNGVCIIAQEIEHAWKVHELEEIPCAKKGVPLTTPPQFFDAVPVYNEANTSSTATPFAFASLLRYLAQPVNVEAFFETLTERLPDECQQYLNVASETSVTGVLQRTEAFSQLFDTLEDIVHTFGTQLRFYQRAKVLGALASTTTAPPVSLQKIGKAVAKLQMRTRDTLQILADAFSGNVAQCAQAYVLGDDILAVSPTDEVVDWDRMEAYMDMTADEVRGRFAGTANADASDIDDDDTDASLFPPGFFMRPRNVHPLTSGTSMATSAPRTAPDRSRRAAYMKIFREIMHWRIALALHLRHFHAYTYWTSLLVCHFANYSHIPYAYNRAFTCAAILQDSVLERQLTLPASVSPGHHPSRGHKHKTTLRWTSFPATLRLCLEYPTDVTYVAPSSQHSGGAKAKSNANAGSSSYRDIRMLMHLYQNAVEAYRYRCVTAILGSTIRTQQGELLETYAPHAMPTTEGMYELIKILADEHRELSKVIVDKNGPYADDIPAMAHTQDPAHAHVWHALSCFQYIRSYESIDMYLHDSSAARAPAKLPKSADSRSQPNLAWYTELFDRLVSYVLFRAEAPSFDDAPVRRYSETDASDDASGDSDSESDSESDSDNETPSESDTPDEDEDDDDALPATHDNDDDKEYNDDDTDSSDET